MARNETKKQKAELSYFISYSQDRLVWHANLVVPLAILYHDHVQWAEEEWSKPLSKKRFMEILEEAGTRVTRSGRGRLKFAVHGVGMLPQ